MTSPHLCTKCGHSFDDASDPGSPVFQQTFTLIADRIVNNVTNEHPVLEADLVAEVVSDDLELTVPMSGDYLMWCLFKFPPAGLRLLEIQMEKRRGYFIGGATGTWKQADGEWLITRFTGFGFNQWHRRVTPNDLESDWTVDPGSDLKRVHKFYGFTPGQYPTMTQLQLGTLNARQLDVVDERRERFKKINNGTDNTEPGRLKRTVKAARLQDELTAAVSQRDRASVGSFVDD